MRAIAKTFDKNTTCCEYLLQNKINDSLALMKNKALKKLEQKNKNRIKVILKEGDLVLIKRFSQNKLHGRFHLIPEKLIKVSKFLVITENIINKVQNIRHRSDVKPYKKLGPNVLPHSIEQLRLHYTDNYDFDLTNKHNDKKPPKRITRQQARSKEPIPSNELWDEMYDSDPNEVDFLT